MFKAEAILFFRRSRERARREDQSMDNTRFVLVRHGQTAWNREVRFRGREDLPLDETGVRQAQAAAQTIAQRYRPAALYSSPLTRTRQTAAPISEATGLSVQIEDGLIDIDYGDWQGLAPTEAAARYGPLYETWLQRPQFVSIPHGESLVEVRARIWTTLTTLRNRHPDQTIVLVGHQATNKVLLCTVLGLTEGAFWSIAQDTACINVFSWTGTRFVLEMLNDTCHLQKM